MSDLIDREYAIKRFCEDGTYLERHGVGMMTLCEAKQRAVDLIESFPSAQPNLDEWCPDCKEYDSKRHCCPRFNRVIRGALKDAQSHWTPCDWCKYNPPSSMDGKPCTICPAVGRGESDED